MIYVILLIDFPTEYLVCILEQHVQNKPKCTKQKYQKIK